MAHILIVDDERSMREFLEILLVKEGYDVSTASGGIEAIAKMSGGAEFDMVVSDLKMPRGDGLQVLEYVKNNQPDTEVVLMTAFSTSETAIRAMRLGAYDYLTKPFKVDEIQVILAKCLEKRTLSVENRRLKIQLKERFNVGQIVGKSREIREVFRIIERVARTRTSILVTGETGTGKELVARALHYSSPRAEKPFVVVNCGAIPENLMESELFGHKKGSFTGAYADKQGLFQEADGGTLFLDEIGELPLSLQVKLLRVLQDRRVKPVGGNRERTVDVRIVAATNRDLEEEVGGERFRQDLYYRLNVVQILIPPLRDRRDDIPLLVQHFLKKFSEEIGHSIRAVEPRAMEALRCYPFPGNIRELENIIERAATFEMTEVLTTESLPPQVLERGRKQVALAAGELDLSGDGVDLEQILTDLETAYLRKALEAADGNRTNAARLLGMSFRSIRYKLAKYGID